MKINNSKFILSALLLLAIDAVYLKFIGGPFYTLAIKKIQGSKMNVRLYSALIVYLFLIIGLYYFIIEPNKTAIEGAFFGLVVYGVFDFTNHAILENYSLPLSIMDTIWGSILCGTTTYLVKKMI